MEAPELKYHNKLNEITLKSTPNESLGTPLQLSLVRHKMMELTPYQMGGNVSTRLEYV